MLIHKQKNKKMKTITNSTIFFAEQAVSIIENAFNQADNEDKFENNCVSALKHEAGKIIIRPKNSFCYDPIILKEALLEKFPPEKYQLTITCFMVIIEEVIK